MLEAIFAAIIAIVGVIALVCIVVLVRNRIKSSSARPVKKQVNTVSSVGVHSSLSNKAAHSHATTDATGAPIKTPADALKSRFSAMTVMSVAIFGALAAKLFSMQVLNSNNYVAAANDNRYTKINTPAPRGYIYDRDGIPLVKNRSSLTILADADVLKNRDVINKLSVVTGLPHNIVRQRLQDTTNGAQSKRTIVSDASLRNCAYIAEHSDAFPGVSVDSRTVRDYPYGALAAHVLGYTGSVSAEELETVSSGRTIEMGDIVGKSGIEASYDDVLAGDHGQRIVIADANGNVRELYSETSPKKGSNVYTTLCGPAQYAAEKALRDLIGPEDGAIGSGKGTAGAVFAMNVKDGSVVVLANFPTYSPASFNDGISQSIWDIYNTEASHYPLLNRAIAGTYPAASTFKAFTGLAGLEYGFADTEKKWNCEGSWDGFDSGDWQDCWEHNGHGEITFREGVVQSCDVVFYEIAKDFWEAGQRGEISQVAMQDVIRLFDFGSVTGIDIAGEAKGRVPDAAWKEEYFRNVPEEAYWRGGDMTNMAIGQGYVLITPAQLAVAYGAIATGNIMKPHLMKEVRNDEGATVVSFTPEVLGTPSVKPENLAIMRDALHGVATDNASLKSRFDAWGIDAACKTGTAEMAGKSDYAWFACYGPFDDPEYVVTVIIEEGGGGAAVAAPVGIDVLGTLLYADKGYYSSADMGKIAGSTGKVVERKDEELDTGRTD